MPTAFFVHTKLRRPTVQTAPLKNSAHTPELILLSRLCSWIIIIWKQEVATHLWTSWNQFSTFEFLLAICTSIRLVLSNLNNFIIQNISHYSNSCGSPMFSWMVWTSYKKPSDQPCQLHALMTIEFKSFQWRWNREAGGPAPPHF